VETLEGRWPNLCVSIEPICDFDLLKLAGWMQSINARLLQAGGQRLMVSVGYDNYGIGLSEPDLSKTEALIRCLEDSEICVERKVLREKIPQRGEWL